MPAKNKTNLGLAPVFFANTALRSRVICTYFKREFGKKNVNIGVLAGFGLLSAGIARLFFISFDFSFLFCGLKFLSRTTRKRQSEAVWAQ